MTTRAWHYIENGIPKGPIDEHMFLQLIRTNVLNGSTMVWCNGMPEWRAISNFKIFTPLLHVNSTNKTVNTNRQIVSAKYYVGENSDISDIDELTKKIIQLAEDGINNVEKVAENISDTMSEFTSNTDGTITDTSEIVGTGLPDTLADITSNSTEALAETSQSFFGALHEFLGDLVSNIIELLSHAMQLILEAFLEVIKATFGFVFELLSSMFDVLLEILSVIFIPFIIIFSILSYILDGPSVSLAIFSIFLILALGLLGGLGDGSE